MQSLLAKVKAKGAVIASKGKTLATSATAYVKHATSDFLKAPEDGKKKPDLLSVAADCQPPWLCTDHPAYKSILSLSEVIFPRKGCELCHAWSDWD